jgi:GTP-binding protein HflX
MIEVRSEDAPRRALLLGVQLPEVSDEEFAESMAELRRLATTLGLVVVGEPITQRRDNLDPAAVLGTGKIEELKLKVESELVDVVVVDHDITPSQLRNLEKATGAEAMDRSGVIIDIFNRHARSRAAKAQVEIVRLKYLAPRLREQAKGRGDRQRGGIGGKGAGESQLELDRRKIRDRIAELSAELEQIESERHTQRARRAEMCRVALVGYTNAGKSTLMRALTGSEVYVADKLFATLDTTVRVIPHTHPRLIVSDTVGFIKKLPHGLVASFKSTLDEALEASLLAHVIDAADPGFERQLETTEEVLREIGAGDIPRLMVFNKIDKVGDEAAQAARRHDLELRWPGCIVLSAKRPDDVIALRDRFVAHFAAELEEREIRLAWSEQHKKGEVFERCQVLEERYDEAGAIFKVRAPRDWNP